MYNSGSVTFNILVYFRCYILRTGEQIFKISVEKIKTPIRRVRVVAKRTYCLGHVCPSVRVDYWISLAQDMYKWWALVIMIMQLWVP